MYRKVVDEAAISQVDEKLEEVEANGEVEEPKEAAPQTTSFSGAGVGSGVAGFSSFTISASTAGTGAGVSSSR
jgi:hypothetical protein